MQPLGQSKAIRTSYFPLVAISNITTNKALTVPYHTPNLWAQPCSHRRELQVGKYRHHAWISSLQRLSHRGCSVPCWRPHLLLNKHSGMLLQMASVRALEWENILKVRLIHSISFFWAFSTMFINYDKNIAWILLENIGPPIVNRLFKESYFFFYSGHCYLNSYLGAS